MRIDAAVFLGIILFVVVFTVVDVCYRSKIRSKGIKHELLTMGLIVLVICGILYIPAY